MSQPGHSSKRTIHCLLLGFGCLLGSACQDEIGLPEPSKDAAVNDGNSEDLEIHDDRDTDSTEDQSADQRDADAENDPDLTDSERVDEDPGDGAREELADLADGRVDETTTGDAAPPELWCASQWPLDSMTIANYLTESLFARVAWDGVALTEPQRARTSVQVGFGPVGSPPSHPSWTWTDAVSNSACPDCSDSTEFMGVASVANAGDYLWAARVRYDGSQAVFCDRSDETRLGSSDGWSSNNAPTLTVAPAAQLQVATVNLRCLIDDWDDRLPILISGLVDLSADLLGLQELCSSEAVDSFVVLQEALSESALDYSDSTRTDTHRSWDTYDEGIGVLSQHRLAERLVVELPPGALPRKAIMTRAATSLGPVIIVSTHLDHRSAGDRSQQIQAIVTAVDDFARDGEIVLISGDLNEETGFVGQVLEEAGFQDLWPALEETSGPTFPSDEPTSRIDQFWLRPGDSEVRPNAIRRFLTEDVEGVWASDHLGVTVELVFP